jgi:hypothetical protein
MVLCSFLARLDTKYCVMSMNQACKFPSVGGSKCVSVGKPLGCSDDMKCFNSLLRCRYSPTSQVHLASYLSIHDGFVFLLANANNNIFLYPSHTYSEFYTGTSNDEDNHLHSFALPVRMPHSRRPHNARLHRRGGDIAPRLTKPPLSPTRLRPHKRQLRSRDRSSHDDDPHQDPVRRRWRPEFLHSQFDRHGAVVAPARR